MIKPKGLLYKLNYLTDDKYQQVIKWLNENENKFEKISISNRKVIQFGYEYDYKKRNVIKLKNEIPNELKLINNKVNQLIINKYERGQKITPHIDSSIFGEKIYCITIGSPGKMVFTLDNNRFEIE